MSLIWPKGQHNCPHQLSALRSTLLAHISPISLLSPHLPRAHSSPGMESAPIPAGQVFSRLLKCTRQRRLQGFCICFSIWNISSLRFSWLPYLLMLLLTYSYTRRPSLATLCLSYVPTLLYFTHGAFYLINMLIKYTCVFCLLSFSAC